MEIVYIVTVISIDGLESCEIFKTEDEALKNKEFIIKNNDTKHLKVNAFMRSFK